MSTYIRRLKLCVILVTVGIVASICVGWQWPVKAASEAPAPSSSQYNLPFGPNPFAPSNARTTTGEFIEPSKFIPASRCVNCHKDTHREWSQSAHRNSFREPFYQANVKHLIRERGIAVTRHCESCHNPVALFSGALTPNAKMARPFDEEGVSCSVCHGIVSTTTKGIGSYTIAPPALLVKANGERLHDATDAEVWDDLPAHRRAVMRPCCARRNSAPPAIRPPSHPSSTGVSGSVPSPSTTSGSSQPSLARPCSRSHAVTMWRLVSRVICLRHPCPKPWPRTAGRAATRRSRRTIDGRIKSRRPKRY
ncbi:MAG: multiheme c-type cytochrome [Pyrinomonadaceae bacterium]